jgi:hypothetical protein
MGSPDVLPRCGRSWGRRVTIRHLRTVCLACNRAEGTLMCDLCSRLVDAEKDADRKRGKLSVVREPK